MAWLKILPSGNLPLFMGRGDCRLPSFRSVGHTLTLTNKPAMFVGCRLSFEDAMLEMKKGFSELKDGQKRLEGWLSKLEGRVSKLEQGQQNIDMMLDMLLEAKVGKQASNMFGTDYVLQFTAQCIWDLVMLLPHEFLFNHVRLGQDSRSTKEDRHFLYMMTSIKVAKQLVYERIPHQLMGAFYDAISKCQDIADYPMQWWVEDGEVGLDMVCFGKFLDVVLKKNKALHKGLLKLKNVLTMSEGDQVDELLRCSGAGLMCLLYYSRPKLHSSSCASVSEMKLPSEVIELDMRGSMNVFEEVGENPMAAVVDIGEVKSQVDYRATIPQLASRLRVIDCLIQVVAGR